MATQADRIAAIKDHFEYLRGEWSIDELAGEFANLPRSICDMPAGTRNQWREAIFENVNSGYLKLIGATHVKRAAPKPAEKKQEAQTLFDFGEGD